MVTDRITALFDSYRAGFERFDIDAVADHFTFPLHITGDSDPVDLRCVNSRDEWLETLAMLLDLYRRLGVKTVKLLDSTTTSLSEGVAHVSMHWDLRDASGETIYDFHGIYTLVTVDGAFRIAAIVHDELGKISAKLS